MIPQSKRLSSAALLKRSTPQAQHSSSAALLKQSTPQAQHSSSKALLKRSIPQTQCSSNELLLKRSDPFLSDHFLDLSIDLLERGLSIRFQANGWSMLPTIADGEIITVAPVAPTNIKVGDIILYHKGRKPIAHRVVKIENRDSEALLKQSTPQAKQSSSEAVLKRSTPHLFYLRGDAHGMCDEPVEPYQIVGRVVSVDRGGRQIALDSRRAKIVLPIRLFTFRLKRWIVKNCIAGVRKNRGLRDEDGRK